MHYHRLEHKMFGQSLGGSAMSEYDRSPCIQCDRLNRSKSECADSCNELKIYQQSLPRFSLWRGDYGDCSMPGFERTPIYINYD
jgi:hypothetical protein